MRIDAIIESTGYHDMLALTLLQNKGSFDTITVYTKRGDEATKAVCVANEVDCIETDLFYKGGSRFNRGAVYNEAFTHLLYGYGLLRQEPGWCCIIDSDIIMPPEWRQTFESLPPDPECFYGARRYNVETQDQYEAIQRDPEYLKRLTLFRGYGYGYLQLFHSRSSTFRRLWFGTNGNPYPEWQDGSTADWMFRNAWGDHPWDPPTQPPDHALRHDVPEPCDPPTGLLRKLPFNVIHIGVTGIGANGRGTPLWNVPTPPSP